MLALHVALQRVYKAMCVQAEERKDTQSDHRNSEGVSVCHSLKLSLDFGLCMDVRHFLQ